MDECRNREGGEMEVWRGRERNGGGEGWRYGEIVGSGGRETEGLVEVERGGVILR